VIAPSAVGIVLAKSYSHSAYRHIKGVCVFIAVIVIAGCSSTRTVTWHGSPNVNTVLQRAVDLRGTSYCSGGDDPDCFDCSGFVNFCFAAANIHIPRTTTELYALGRFVERNDLEAGDLVFFRTVSKGASHVGIYVNDNTFIHSSTSKGVIISSLNDSYWGPRYLGARRVVME